MRIPSLFSSLPFLLVSVPIPSLHFTLSLDFGGRTPSSFLPLLLPLLTLFTYFFPSIAWTNTSLLVVRVGDGALCPSTSTSCTRATQVYLDEYNYLTGGLVGSQTLVGVTLSANDQYVGALSRCADGTCAVFGAQTAPTSTVPTTTAPFFTGNRVIVRVKADNSIDSTTTLAQADYGGLFKGVCSRDGTGYWIAGNATNTCIGYVAHGTSSSNFVNVANGVNCQTAEGSMHGRYTGCVVVNNPTNIYFTRTYAIYGFVDVTSTPSTSWTTASSLAITGTTTSVLNAGFNNPWYFSQIITNYAQTLFWIVEPNQCGIVLCRDRSSLPNLPRATTLQSNGCTYVYGGTPGTSPCAFSGITLSPDESTLFFTSRNTIYKLPSEGGPIGVVTTLTTPYNEFRGVALPPYECTASGTPLEGYYCTGSAGSALLPCSAGTYAPLGTTTSCLNCPAGTFSGSMATRQCTPCSSGIYCAAGSTNNSVLCPPGYYCPAGGAPVACSAGIYCPAGSSVNTVPCIAGYYCPGGGVAPQPCGTGTASSAISQTSSSTCQTCGTGTYAETEGSSSCTKCPIGSYNPNTGSTARSACLFCAAGFYCPEGSSTNTQACPAGWFCGGGNRETAPCPSGRYSSTVSATSNATCIACGAGIWCPPGSTNASVTCQPGWACPGGGNPNAICGPGFFATGYGNTVCQLCAAGSLANTFGATSCTICPAGTYLEAGSASLTCSQCPANTYSPNPGAGSRAFCLPCPSGYSSQPGSTACQAMAWTKINPPFPLTGRQGGIAMANSTAFLAIGGRRSDGTLSDLSLGYDAYSGNIIESRTVNASFEGAAIASHPTDGSVYVFGGTDSSGKETNTLWRVNSATNDLPSSTRITFPVTPAPSARKLAGMAYLTPCPAMAGACLVLIGGERSGTLLSDVWVYDLTANVWSQPTGTNVRMPSARSGHAVVAAPNSSMLYVFGGRTTTGVSNELFALNPFGFWDAVPSEMVNLALNKLTTMSGNDPALSTRGSAAAVDGSVTTRHNPVVAGDPSTCACNWCAMTPTGPTNNLYGSNVGTTNPWWGIDLGSVQTIDFLYIYMRQPAASGQYTYDFPFGKSAGAVLYASNSNSTPAAPCPSTAPFGAINQTACPYTSVGSGCPPGTVSTGSGCAINVPLGTQIPVGGPNIYATTGLQARYLWLTLPGLYRILALCEFQVYQKRPWVWRTLSGTFNAALYGRATQSSTLSGFGDGQAYRAVDGLLTNKLDNAQPYTLSSTRDGGDTPFTWWQVDMGQQVDIQFINVYGRSDCCTNRNLNIFWYVGDSTDYTFNTLCKNSPTDITPSTVLTDPTCTTGPEVVTTLGAPPTACYKTFTCPARGRYLQAVKLATDRNALMLGEVQAIANKLLDLPSGRTGMSVSAFGGNMVLFGGADRSGFRNNEVRFYNMLTNKWLPPLDPIGTLPVARASAFFALMPSSTFNVPSSKFALFGGYSNTDQLNDFMVLSVPACPAFDTSIASSVTCYQGGTVCYITCQAYSVSANGNNPVVCQPDGSWTGNFPVCKVLAPTKPLNVQASVNNNGIVTVTWTPPASNGYYFAANSLVSYNVKVVGDDVYENFATGQFPAPIGTTNTLGTGWSYLGGNWYSMLPKAGIRGAYGWDPAVPSTTCCVQTWPQVTFTCCLSSNTATLLSGVSNTYDFWNGFLRLDSDYFRTNIYDKHDNMVLVRDWPANLDPAGPWAYETFASLDVNNIVGAPDQAACLGLVDISDYNNMGMVEFMACIRNNGAQLYQVQLAHTNRAFETLLDTTPFTTAYTKTFAAYFRIEHIPSEYPTSFRAYWKLNVADVWIKFPVFPNQLLNHNGPISPANFRPALLVRNGNLQIRAVGLFSYFRIGPTVCSNLGSERFVTAAANSALIYGLTQGSSYRFTVSASTLAGFGDFSDPSTAVTIPIVPNVDNFPLISQGRPCSFSSFASNTLYFCENAFDGLLNTFAWTNSLADGNGGYGWIQVDLGSTRAVRFLRVVARQDTGQARVNNFQVWVSSNTNFVATGQQCNTALYNPIVSTAPGFSVTFACFAMGSTTQILSGQYVTLRRNPSIIDSFNVAEFQVFGAADNPLVSQNKPCRMSSTFSINTCAFAVDGRLDTYAQNNNDAPTTGVLLGWLTVDLGVATVISSIRITARQDADATTLDNFKVYVGELPNFYTDVYNINMMCNQSYLPRTFSTLPGNTSEFRCVVNDNLGYKTNMPAMGRYVTVQFTNGPRFSIAELQVYSANFVLASYNKPCKMSSSLGGRVCNVAFNGIHNVLGEYAATATSNDIDNYLTVDLGFSSAVRAIKMIGFPNPAYDQNFEFYVGDSSNYHQNVMCDPTNIPRLLSANENWQHAFACSLTGRYVTMHVPTNNIVTTELQVFTANACPPRTATGATQLGGSVCGSAGWGQVCTHVCNAGWVPISGSASSTCNGQTWDKPPLVCAPTCPDLLPPAYAASCTQTLFSESFNINGALSRFISLNPYTQLIGLPVDNPPQKSTWFQLDGMLQASGLPSCTPDMQLAIASSKIYDWSSGFTLSARISTANRAGLIFRAQSSTNLLRFYFDVVTGMAAIERVVDGTPIIISSVYSYLFKTPNVFQSISVSVLNSQINVTLNSQLVLTTSDRTYLIGYAGVYAQGSALFDDLTHTVACTTCQGMTDSSTCTFSCQDGLIAVGPLSRTCFGTTSVASMTFSPDLVTQPLICTLPAPTFLPASLLILENSNKNANVGDPLVAFSTSPDYQVQFQIMALYQTAFYKNSSYVPNIVDNQGLFWVDACTGQVKLRTGGKDVMDYEGVNQYILTVRAFISGFTGAETIRNVTVNVLNLDEPPIALATTVTLNENSAAVADGSAYVWASLANQLTGAMQYWDPENSTVQFTVTVDGSNGRLLLANLTGNISVANAISSANNTVSQVPFNFETTSGPLVLSIMVSQRNDSTMVSTASYSVELVDMNDPPTMAKDQVLSLSEYASALNPSSTVYPVLAGYVNAFDEDTNSSWNNGTIFSLLSGAAAASSCGQTTNWPTNDDTQSGSALFSIDPSTGGITLTANPLTGAPHEWRLRTPIVSNGKLLRVAYSVCVKAADVAGAFSSQLVTVNILADAPSLPYITDMLGAKPDPVTSGGTLITFNGANFMPGNAILPLTVYYTNTKFVYYGVNCSIESNSTITCYTAPGFDKDYTWYLNLGGTDIIPLVSLTMSYAEPIVTSLSVNAQSVGTPGNVIVTFYGDNFGPNSAQNPRTGGYIYNYSLPTLYFGNNGFEFDCARFFWNHTVFQCTMPAGVGKDLSWSLNVGSNSFVSANGVAPSTMLLSYSPPIITGVTGATVSVDVTKLDTYGGEAVIITGQNFGPASIVWRMDGSSHITLTDPFYGVTSVTFGGAVGTLLSFVGCTQSPVTAHTTITCFTASGVGTNHRVNVQIAGQTSGVWPATLPIVNASCAGGLCFLPPVLTSISGPGVTAADTVGGQLVIITGRHFGPITFPTPAIDYVYYGRPETNPTHFQGKQCSVTAQTSTVSQITCVTDQGVGSGLVWQLSIGGQPAAGATLKSSYAAPQVFVFSGTGAVDANTVGNEPVIITGRNFGPADAYTNNLLSVNYGVALKEGDAGFLAAIPSVRYIAASCTISVAHTELTCNTVEGAGYGMDWKVTIDGLSSSNPTTSYHAPVVDTITYEDGQPVTAADVNGGEIVILNGNFFGPVVYKNTSRSLLQRVTYGLLGTEFEAKNYTVLDGNRIRVTLLPGIGTNLRFVVLVADQFSPSSTGTFSYARPVVVAVVPSRASTYSSPSAPTAITLYTRNLPLLDPSTIYRITFGQGAFQQIRDISLPLVNKAAIAAKTNPDGTINATFLLPKDGAGANLAVSINVYQGSLGALVATTNATATNSVFSYLDPVIEAVIVTRALFDVNGTGNLGDGYFPCPPWNMYWSCTDNTVYQITVQGSNFGEDPSKMDYSDGVLRSLEMVAFNDTASGLVLWAKSSPGAPTDDKNILYLQKWSHTSIIAFVRRTTGRLRLSLTSQSTAYQPVGASVVQSVEYEFANVNPTISNLVGETKDIPTNGSSTALSVTVDGLNGANDVKVFIGDPRLGIEATIVCPPVGVTPLPTDKCTSIYTSIIQPAANGNAEISFFAPPGQGTDQPVIVVIYITGFPPKASTDGFKISYKAPRIDTFSIQLAPNVWSTPVNVWTAVDPTVTAPTNGTGKVRLYGSNFGTNPSIMVGDLKTVLFKDMIRCDLPDMNHTCLEFFVPAGEGNGMQFPENIYPNRPAPPYGYQLYVSFDTKTIDYPDSNKVKFMYVSPIIYSVTSADNKFSTKGGNTLSIVGGNFGEQNDIRPEASDIKVQFVNLDNAGDILNCTDPIRQSHSLITCTLPEGAGRSLKVIVTVAGLVGESSVGLFGYDVPEITSAYLVPASFIYDPLDIDASFDSSLALEGVVIVPGINSSSLALRTNTNDEDYLVIRGTNFGRAEINNCMFISWWNRPEGINITCDRLETFLGEGEVDQSQVVYWSHEFVVVKTSIGIGFKEILVSIRGNTLNFGRRSTQSVRLTYNAPVIYRLSPDKGPTKGHEPKNPARITIQGSNFGATPYDLSTAPLIYPIPISLAPAAPTAYVVVIFHSSCVAKPYNIFSAPVSKLNVTTENSMVPLYSTEPNVGCSRNGFFILNSTDLSFELPPGVGATKNVSVAIVDAEQSTLYVKSNKLNFSYKPPRITGFDPRPYFATWTYDSRSESMVAQMKELTIEGDDFGNFELASTQSWSKLEQQLILSIGGIPCLEDKDANGKKVYTSLKRSRDGGSYDENGALTNAPSTIVKCTLDIRYLLAGIPNVTISIAGQTYTAPAYNPAFENVTELPKGVLVIGCAPNSYGRMGELCRVCPAQNLGTGLLAGARCDGYIDDDTIPFSQRFTYPHPTKGWYNLNSSDANTRKWGNPDGTQMTACPPNFQDAGRDVCIVPCDPPESCLEDNICSYGYASKYPTWKCSACDIGFYRQGYTCVKCPDSPWALVIGFVLLVIFAGCVGYLLNQKGVNIAVIGIGIDFFQVLAIFATSGVKWPPVVKELLHVLSAFNLNIEIVAPECIVPDLNYKQKFYFIMLLPLSVGGLLLGGVWTSLYVYKAYIKGQGKAQRISHTPALVSSVLSLIYILYLYLTRTIFDVFTCTPTFPPDGRYYMNVANKEECGIPGGTQVTLLPYAVAGLVVYSFGYPVYVGYLLWTNRQLVMLDQVLRAKGSGDDKLTNPHAFDFRNMYGRAYFQFKPDWCMWILAVILRKFFIAVTAVVFSKNSSFQMAACLLIMFLAYSAQVMVRPYMGPAEFEEVVRLVTESSLTNERYARIRALISTIESRGRKKVRRNLLNSEGQIDTSAILGVLTGWLFNYNTVEQIMIFCAVIVCLMGIMYQANQANSFYPGALDGVTAVVMITIIFAIIYYVTIVVTEMVIMYNEETSRKRARIAARKGDKGKKLDSPARTPGGGRLVDADGDIHTGKLDTQMNPLFMNKDGAIDTSSVTGIDAILAQRDPPPPTMWRFIQQGYVDIYRQLEDAQTRLAEARKREQLRETEEGSMDPNEQAGFVPSSPTMTKESKKKSFAPQGTNSPNVNPMNSYRKGGPLALKASRRNMKGDEE